MTDTPASRWTCRDHGIASREVEDEAVVLDTEARVYHALNPSGRLLWRRLEAGASPGQLAEALTERYDVTRAQAAEDVGAFLQALVDRDLVEADR